MEVDISSFEWPPQGGSGGGSGTVTSLSVVSAHGFAGTVANPTTTPAITLSTTITGLLQGDGTSISAATTGNLTEATSSVLTITAGTGAVLGSGTSIQVKQASGSVSGYLSSTDWTTFNNKSPSGNFATSGTGDVSWSAPSGPGAVSTSLVATTNSSLTTLSALSLPATQLSGTIVAARMPAFTGDITTTAGSINTTLATVNTNTGSFGSSTSIPNFTVNGKGLLTAAGSNVVIAPAGTLSGTTLNATVVTSSLTAVGTIATGVWNGTTIAIANGGTGQTSANNALNALLPTQTSNSGKFLKTDGTNSSWAAPTISLKAPTIQQFTSSTGTYTTPTSPAPLYIRVVMVGGGGGGGGGGTSGGTSGGGGGNTTFGTTLLAANGGTGGGGTSGPALSPGGSASLGSGPVGLALSGSGGQGGQFTNTSNGILVGGQGGSGLNGAGAGAGGYDAAGSDAGVNSGAGGGGGSGGGGITNDVSGAGGGAGGFVDAIITSPSSTYAYAVGAAGTAGSAGSSGFAGGAGGLGLITVYEYYQ